MASGMRFQTRVGLDAHLSSASGPAGLQAIVYPVVESRGLNPQPSVRRAPVDVGLLDQPDDPFSSFLGGGASHLVSPSAIMLFLSRRT